MSDFKNPDAGWYFDQYEALRAAGGKVSREQFVSTCHIFRAAGYNEALAAAAPDGDVAEAPGLRRALRVVAEYERVLTAFDAKVTAGPEHPVHARGEGAHRAAEIIAQRIRGALNQIEHPEQYTDGDDDE